MRGFMRRNVVVAASLTSVALALGTVGLPGAAAKTNDRGKVIHLTAVIAQQVFTGDPSSPQLGNQFILNGDLFDDSNVNVGHVATSCTVVSVPPRATEVTCLGDTVLAEGKITVGGVAPFPPSATPVQFSILGGTDEFRKARGDFVVFAVSPNRLDGTFHLLN
jgi:hypothetical protein